MDFLRELDRELDLVLERLRDRSRFAEALPLGGGGTFAPFLRASDRPIATACFRLFTFPPCPALPRRSVPRLRRRIALSTLLLAFLPYFRPVDFREDVFFVAMEYSVCERTCPSGAATCRPRPE